MTNETRPRWLLLDSELYQRLVHLSAPAFTAYVTSCTYFAHWGIESIGRRALTLFTRRRWSVERELLRAGLWIIDGDDVRLGHPDGVPVIKRFGSRPPTNRVRRPITPRTRYGVLERDGFRCQACGASSADDDVVLHVDHIDPVAKGGTNDLANLQTLCADCNLGKADQ